MRDDMSYKRRTGHCIYRETEEGTPHSLPNCVHRGGVPTPKGTACEPADTAALAHIVTWTL